MDRLLDKLRHNMAELSVQGDDFTRQIWHMYATFEEFIDTHAVFGHPPGESAAPLPKPPTGGGGGGRRARRRSRAASHHRIIGGSALELARPRRPDPAPPAPISSSAPAAPTHHERFTFDARDEASVSGGYRKPPHRCRYRRSRRRLDNPLLDTISAIQDYGGEESDDHDYGDPHACFVRRFGSDPDRDSIGYAGSNSIDSGYKSSCPTPEPLEAIYYGSAEAKRGSGASQRPRIAMGTKVMNRHSHPRSSTRDLDHLMYLRQSILSAMQRYEQQAVVSAPSMGFRPRSASASGSYMQASYPGSRTHSPGCYSSASYGSGVSSPGCQGQGQSQGARARVAMAEEDIDSLLHGSYVTMREDKYRHSSIARVKKLREKSQRKGSSGSSSDSSCPSPPASPPPGRFSEVAKCMLEIIEDLQNQTQTGSEPPPEETCPPAPAPSGPAPTPAPTPIPDYHVYEEIMYELTVRPTADPAPPPLPARPDTIFRPSKQRHAPQPHRPKQRSNLYSLFQEAGARRDISHSLEQEFLGAMAHTEAGHRPRTAEEEYGFRMPT